MSYELKVRKIGNSYGVVLPKEALATLRVKEGDTLTLAESAHGSMSLSAYRDEVSRQMTVVQDVMDRYRHTLRELAK
jgi:putative addiction module antidote